MTPGLIFLALGVLWLILERTRTAFTLPPGTPAPGTPGSDGNEPPSSGTPSADVTANDPIATVPWSYEPGYPGRPAVFRDVCDDGLIVESNGPETGEPASVRFGSDPPIALPTYGLFLRAVRIPDVTHMAIVAGHADDIVRTIDRRGNVVALGPAFGTYSCAFTPDGHAVFVTAPGVVNIAGVNHPMPDTYSDGLLDYIYPNGALWSGVPANRTITLGGRQFFLPMRRGRWTIGQTDDGGDIIAAFDHATGRTWVVERDRHLYAPHIAELSDGTAIAAVPYSFAGGVSRSTSWTLLNAPSVVVPQFRAPVFVAPFFATNTPRWPERGSWDHAGNAELLNNGIPVQEMRRLRPWFADRESWLESNRRGLSAAQRSAFRGFYSAWVEGGIQNMAELEANRADARTLGVWHLVYADAGEYPDAALAWLNPSNESPMVRAYPEPGETALARAERLQRNLTRASARGLRASIALPFYTQSGNWTISNVAAGLETCLRVAVTEQDRLLVLGAFSYARPSGMRDVRLADGTFFQGSPLLLSTFDRLSASVPSAPGLPGVIGPAPTPIPVQPPDGGSGGGSLPATGPGPDWSGTPGTTQPDGSMIVTDGQRWLPIGATFFSLAWGYKFDRDRLGENLRWLRDNGVDYVRALAQVGPEAWTDRVIDPAWSDYESIIAGATDYASSFGLRTQWTIIGGGSTAESSASRLALVQRLIPIFRERSDRIIAIEIANEAEGIWNDPIAVREACARVRTGTPIMTALSALGGGAAAEAFQHWYDGSAANLLTVHLDRSWSGTCGDWRPVRQPWEVQFLDGVPRCWSNNEPIGPQSSVQPDDDPLRQTMLAATVWMTGGAFNVFHCGPGIRFGGREDLERGRASNVWDAPNAGAILAGWRTVREHLPSDIPAGVRLNSNRNFPAYPFDVEPILVAAEAGQICRLYANVIGDTLRITALQHTGAFPLIARQPLTLSQRHPLTWDELDAVTLDAGQTWNFQPRAAGSILEGRFL